MSKKKRILLLILFITVVMAIRFSPLSDILTFDNIKQHRDTLTLFVQDHYWLSVVLFIALYILVVGFSLPGAEMLTIPGGFLFGTVIATIYVNIGATAGSALAFLSARYLLGQQLQEKFRDPLEKFNEAVNKNGARYLLTLRLIPLMPFVLINFLSGLTKIPIKTFIWTTSLGIIPGTAVYAFAGRQLGTINQPSEILSLKVITAFATLALFAMFPIVLNFLKTSRNKSEIPGKGRWHAWTGRKRFRKY